MFKYKIIPFWTAYNHHREHVPEFIQSMNADCLTTLFYLAHQENLDPKIKKLVENRLRALLQDHDNKMEIMDFQLLLFHDFVTQKDNTEVQERYIMLAKEIKDIFLANEQDKKLLLQYRKLKTGKKGQELTQINQEIDLLIEKSKKNLLELAQLNTHRDQLYSRIHLEFKTQLKNNLSECRRMRDQQEDISRNLRDEVMRWHTFKDQLQGFSCASWARVSVEQQDHVVQKNLEYCQTLDTRVQQNKQVQTWWGQILKMKADQLYDALQTMYPVLSQRQEERPPLLEKIEPIDRFMFVIREAVAKINEYHPLDLFFVLNTSPMRWDVEPFISDEDLPYDLAQLPDHEKINLVQYMQHCIKRYIAEPEERSEVQKFTRLCFAQCDPYVEDNEDLFTEKETQYQAELQRLNQDYQRALTVLAECKRYCMNAHHPEEQVIFKRAEQAALDNVADHMNRIESYKAHYTATRSLYSRIQNQVTTSFNDLQELFMTAYRRMELQKRATLASVWMSDSLFHFTYTKIPHDRLLKTADVILHPSAARDVLILKPQEILCAQKMKFNTKAVQITQTANNDVNCYFAHDVMLTDFEYEEAALQQAYMFLCNDPHLQQGIKMTGFNQKQEERVCAALLFLKPDLNIKSINLSGSNATLPHKKKIWYFFDSKDLDLEQYIKTNLPLAFADPTLRKQAQAQLLHDQYTQALDPLKLRQ